MSGSGRLEAPGGGRAEEQRRAEEGVRHAGGQGTLEKLGRAWTQRPWHEEFGLVPEASRACDARLSGGSRGYCGGGHGLEQLLNNICPQAER